MLHIATFIDAVYNLLVLARRRKLQGLTSQCALNIVHPTSASNSTPIERNHSGKEIGSSNTSRQPECAANSHCGISHHSGPYRWSEFMLEIPTAAICQPSIFDNKAPV